MFLYSVVLRALRTFYKNMHFAGDCVRFCALRWLTSAVFPVNLDVAGLQKRLRKIVGGYWKSARILDSSRARTLDS